MKKLILVFISSIVFVLVIFIYLVFLSPSARKARRNEKLSRSIKIGMTSGKVIEIMGKPDEIFIDHVEQKDMVLYYEPSFGSSDGIYIYYDSSDKVSRIRYAD